MTERNMTDRNQVFASPILYLTEYTQLEDWESQEYVDKTNSSWLCADLTQDRWPGLNGDPIQIFASATPDHFPGIKPAVAKPNHNLRGDLAEQWCYGPDKPDNLDEVLRYTMYALFLEQLEVDEVYVWVISKGEE